MSSMISIPSLTQKVHRRKKKISLSPVKSFSTVDEVAQSAALEFNEFSFWDDAQGFITPTSEQRESLRRYLRNRFGCNDFQESGPFLLLFCETIPDPDTRPFTIGDCVAIYLEEDSGIPPEISLGDLADGTDIKLEDEVAHELFPYRLPTASVLEAVAKHFPSAEYVTYYTTGIIVELPSQSDESYFKCLETLPAHFPNSGATLQYHNGPKAITEMKRRVKPNPKEIEGIADETNYIENGGCCYPGVMLSATDGHCITAGVLVRKADEIRLTVAFHCWDDEYATHSDKFGDASHFRIIQGNLTDGVDIGYVAERLWKTDIGLAKLNDNVHFNNRFMEIEAEAKELLKSSTIRFNDEFVIDGYVTGRHKLKCLGIRTRTDDTGERDFVTTEANRHLYPPAGTYIRLVQGIYATSAPIIKSKPMIRAGVCRAAIVRCSKSGGGNVEGEGGFAGFMQWSDLKSRTSNGVEFLCFCETLDDMIADGWEIVKVAGKRKAEDEE